MKVRRHNSLNSLLATLLVVVAAAGCVEPIDITPPEVTDDVELTFQIALPDAGILTKADTDIAAVGDESKIYDLQVWAFTHEGTPDETAVGYGHVTSDGTIPTITMKLPSRIVNGTNPKLDFYALANGPSVGFNPVKYPMRSALQGATFGDGNGAGFGTECVSAVPNETDYKGLPMACYSADDFDVKFLRYGFTADQLKGKTGENTYIPNGQLFSSVETIDAAIDNIVGNLTQLQKTNLRALFVNNGDDKDEYPYKWDYSKFSPTMSLTRAVGKIRFVFAKAASMTVTTAEGVKPVNTEIISISLIDKETATAADTTDMLPKETYLFPRETGNVVHSAGTGTEYPEDDYAALFWIGDNGPLVPSSSFVGNTIDMPLRLRWDEYKSANPSATLSDYSAFLDDEINQNHHAIEKVLYLRESDKEHAYCRIRYKIGDNLGSTDIRIPDDSKVLRNSWWTVYAYFISYELGFQVTAADWDGIGSSPNDNSHLQ